MPDPFSAERVQQAIGRLPSLSTKAIKETRRRGDEKRIPDLVAACDEELSRRPIEYDGDTAARMIGAEASVVDFDLASATRYAFGEFWPASDPERRILKWMAAHPGGSHAELAKAYGKGDLSLTIGHLVYDRYGCFRRFVAGHKEQSSVLIERDSKQGSVRYTIRPEVLSVFRELKIV